MKNRLLSFILSLVFIFSLIPVPTADAAEITNDTCGENIASDANGILDSYDDNTAWAAGGIEPKTATSILMSGSCGANVTYTLYSSGLLEISGSGAMTDYGTESPPWVAQKDNISRIVVSAGVTSIGKLAFNTCQYLTQVELPDSVTSIGESAFGNCGALEDINLPAKLTTIGQMAFSSCASLTSVVIPDGVTVINDYAFMRCSGLTSVTLPANLTTIGANAFNYCTSLESLDIPNRVSAIGAAAFAWCTGLSGITFTGNAPTFGSDQVFMGVTTTCYYPANLDTWTAAVRQNYGGTITWVAVGDTPGGNDGEEGGEGGSGNEGGSGSEDDEDIDYGDVILSGYCGPEATYMLYRSGLLVIQGTGAMYDFSSIANPWWYFRSSINKVIIRQGITTVGAESFEDCANLTSVDLPNSLISIGDYAFALCNNLASIELPDNLTCIGIYAFRDCSSLTSINLPAGLTVIADHAFTGCSSITSIDIPDSVTRIDRYAFSLCHNLASIELPDNLTYIGEYAFYACSMASISLPDGLTYIGNDAFIGCTNLTSITLPNNLTFLGGGAFSGCTGLTYIQIPGSVEDIGASAFANCSNLTSVVISDGVTSIGHSAFYQCTALTSISLPNSLTSIGNKAFQWCQKLENINFPEGLTTIDSEAFSLCQKLTNIELPTSLTTIGSKAFYGCSAMKTITFRGHAPSFGSDAFLYMRYDATCYYPAYDETWTASVRQNYGANRINWVGKTCSGEHSWKYATCTTPQTCTVCGMTDGTALGHSYDSIITQPTCTAQGYMTHTCSACGDSYVDGHVAALGHSYGDWYVTDEANCTEAGEERQDCANCDHYETQTVPAVGHSYTSVVTAPTCTEQGYTTHTCSVCGDSYVDSYVATLGHTEVVDQQILPTSGKIGLTEGKHCSVCGEVLAAQQTVAAKGYDWMLEDNTFKILLIGNSYSQDASNCGQGMTTSQLLDIFQAMLGEDVKIVVGLAQSGGKGMHWHATQAEQGNRIYGFTVISTDNPVWKSVGTSTSEEVLSWTDWDVVSLQPYNVNTSTGKESVPYPDSTDEKFYLLENASAFMLDFVDQYAPQADVYCYMHWAQTKSTQLNSALSSYNKLAGFYPGVLDYTGTNSGKVFANVIPVGLSVQNARTTYLALLQYNITAYDDGNLNLTTDAQIGLQRDGGHLSFNIGRYIAALTFAETIIPEEMREEGYVLPDIRTTESIGVLPQEYTVLAQKSVLAAVESWKNGSLAVTNIEGYTEDPTVAAGETLAAMTITDACGTDTASLAKQVKASILAALPEDFAVDSVTFPEEFTLAGAGQVYSCDVTIRFGYTSLTVPMSGIIADHTYTSTTTASTCTEQGYTTHTCAACGDNYVDSYVAALGHSFGDWHVTDAANCTENGEERRDCERCDAYEMQTVPAVGHSYTSVVTAPTCTAQGYTTHTCAACGDSYVDSYVDALGHKWQDADCTTAKTCGVCHVTEGEALGHNYGSVVTPPTCTAQGYTTHTCTRCGDSYVDAYVDALGHSFGDWHVTDAANCTEDGEQRRDCERCDAYETKTVPAVGHSYTAVVTAPTCTAAGFTTHTCECGSSYVDSYVNALGHSYTAVVTAPTCTAAGFTTHTCECGSSYVDSYVNALGHSYTSVVTAPTCTEQGYTTHTCTACGDSYVDSYVNALGHSFGDWYVTDAANCTENGEQRRDCERCDAYEMQTVPAVGHSYTAVATAPTCTEQGYTTHTCSACGDSYVDSYMDALGHNWTNAACTTPKTCIVCHVTEGEALGHSYGAWYVTDEANCTEKGEQRRDCERCDAYEMQTVPAVGHSYTAVVTAPTCTEQGYTTHTCSACGDSYVDSYVDALGHTSGEEVWENEVSGSYDAVIYCTVCGDELSRTTVITHVPGDTNGDGVINNKDATRLFQYLSGWDVEVAEEALDVNGDGSVNNKDATRLFQYLSGWDVEIF